jgi:O-antigen/teichoic acid export membrane protein
MWIGVVQILNFAIPLFTLPIASRAFGPGTYGLIASLTAMAAYAGLCITFGFHLTGPRLVARTPPDAPALSLAFSTIFLGQVAFAVLAFAIGVPALVLIAHHAGAAPILAIVVLAGVVASALTPMWMFVGLQSVRSIVLSQLAMRAGAAVLIVALVRQEGDALLFVVANAVSAVLSCGAALLILHRRGIVIRPVAPAAIARAIAAAGRLFVSAVAINLYTTTNLVVVSLMLGPVAAGYFALADRVRGAVVGLFEPVSQSLYPYLCGSDPTADREHNRRLFFRAIVVLSLLAVLVLYGLSPLIAAVLGGERFARSVPLLQILSLTPLLICLSNILGIQTMLPDNMERQLSRIVTVAGVLGIPLLAGATSLFGLAGAAWSYVIVEAGVTLAMALCVARRRSLAALFFRPASEVRDRKPAAPAGLA